jgi:hypothetical protein
MTPQVKSTSNPVDLIMRALNVDPIKRLALSVVLILGALAADASASPRKVVRAAADALVARQRPMPAGGAAWQSAIQAPHYQTDRDVGAASIGEGLLAAYAVTRDRRYRRAAVTAGDFLLGVAEPDDGGLRWPDWADPDGSRSTTHFTSFDDGAAGISDYLWRLSRVTHKRRFRAGALAGMRWLVAQAEGARWRWTDDPDWRVAYNGVGMGQAGVVLTLDAFADRTGDPTLRAHARAGAAELRRLTRDGTRPLAEPGFLEGSAGAAYVFLDRYAHDRDPADLATARRLLAWANAQPFGASGFELGAAGIAWVNLQFARVTADAAYRTAARRAGAWLRQVQLTPGRWAEWPGEASPVHIGLDSGTAGIGWVLEDLARAGIDPAANRRAARSALAALKGAARREPSWHWGSAGIAAFAAHLAGWSGRGPGGQRSGPVRDRSS